jgi:hypothetical protein
MINKFRQLKDWYEKNERRVSTASLLTGFVLDSLTLQSVDSLFENLWIAGNFILVAICIVLINRYENTQRGEPSAGEAEKHFWLFNIIQFGFGALLGAFFIFYFRSATLSATWPFLAILLGAMTANELFKNRYARLTFQLSFFYLCLFSFSIFLMPLVFHRIGALVFLFSGATSLAALWGFLSVLKRFARERFRKSWAPLTRSVAAIFIIVNILYFTNLIPPIPLSLKDAGIYHSISRTVAGNYAVSGEEKNWTRYFHYREKVNWRRGEPLYAYSAIFSPGAINTDIVHEWQYKNDPPAGGGEWVTATRIPLYLSGGRDEGFRTYSVKYNLAPGSWRVNVETPKGQLIGRINFKIIESSAHPALETSIKK